MELSEAYDLFGEATIGDADTKYSRYLPRLNTSGRIALEDVDGRTHSIRAREVEQWVSTLEDNNDLTFAIQSAGKQRLKSFASRLTVLITDARVVFVQEKVKDPQRRTVGQIRFPWVSAIAWRPRRGRFTRARIELWMHEDFPVKHLGTWFHSIYIDFDDDFNTESLALDLVHRVAAHNLAHGAPSWAHSALRSQAQLQALPSPDTDDEDGFWSSPATLSCPLGAEYIGDSPKPGEWVGPGAPSTDSPDQSDDANHHDKAGASPATTALALNRVLARAHSISRRRGMTKPTTSDLLLALMVDEDTPVSRLLAEHDLEYLTVARQVYRDQPIRGAVVGGQSSMSTVIARRWIRQTSQIGSGDGSYDLVAAQRLVDIAKDSGLSTARAYADVVLGDALLKFNRTSDAGSAYASAKTLRRGPIVKVAPLQPSLDPLAIVDDALVGLHEVATRVHDEAAQRVAMENLQRFRAEYRPTYLSD